MRRYIEAFAAFALFVALSATPARAQAPSTADALAERALGKADAPVTILDYSSLTCPHCARFHSEVLPQLKERFIDTGKAKLVFRDFPFDQWALKASMLARCAPAERYFPLLDILFKQQTQWAHGADPGKALAQIGKLAGLTQATIDACWANQEIADGILKMRMEGSGKYNVDSTPTFILNDGAERISGAQSVDAFAAAIERLSK